MSKLSTSSDPPSARRLRQISRAIGVSLGVMSALVLLGWVVGNVRLKSVVPGLISMKPNTAVGFALIGLLLVQRQPRPRAKEAILAGALLILGTATLLEYAFNWDLHIDQALFHDDSHERFLGRMSIATAWNFVLLGLAVPLRNLRIGVSGGPLKRLSEWAVLVVGLSALLGLLGYLYGVWALYALGPYLSFALHTAVAFVFASLGLLLSTPDEGLMRLFMSDGPGGVLARRMVPAVIVGPILLGWLRLWGQRLGWYQTEFGLALFVISDIVCFTALVWWTATALSRSDTALRRSEARFKRLLESGIIGIVFADTSGAIHEANDAFLRIVGYSREDLAAGRLHSSTLNPPELQPARQRAQAELETSGVTLPWEKEFVRKDGSRVAVLIGVTMLEPPDCLNIIIDLTEQKRTEEAVRILREQREVDARFRALLEAAPDAMAIADDQGRLVLVNAQTERLFGYSREALLGQPLELLVQTAGDQKESAIGRRQDGSMFPVEMSQSPIETSAGRLLSSAIRDVTRRKLAEAELFRAKEVAETASRELEAFSYSVAHDLRAPLRGISGFSTVLVEDYAAELGDEARALLGRIVAGANQMGLLIDALLQLSRVTRGEPSRLRVDLAQVASTVAGQLRASEPDRDVQFVIPPELRVWGDPSLLRSLLENLLGNAWKFSAKRPHARIELGCSRHGDGLAYFVRDNGAGFNQAYASRLFTPFQRLHTGAEFLGTGIGLATVQRIVQRHGGKIWAVGEVNQGATFHFTLATETETTG